MFQIPIDFTLEPRLTLAEYVVGDNQEVVHRLERILEQPGFRSVWLSGAAATGKTHLLQATVRRAPVAVSVYFPARRLKGHLPHCFDGLSEMRVIAIDDVDLLLGDPVVEAALLGTYQEMLHSGGCLLLSASQSSAALKFAVPDLASRFRAAAHYALLPLNDDQLRTLIKKRAQQRTLPLSEPVLDYWLHRSPRQVDILLQQLDTLDRAARSEKRKLTVPLVKAALDL